MKDYNIPRIDEDIDNKGSYYRIPPDIVVTEKKGAYDEEYVYENSETVEKRKTVKSVESYPEKLEFFKNEKGYFVSEDKNFIYMKDNYGRLWITKYKDREGIELVTIPKYVSGFVRSCFTGAKYIKKIIGTSPLTGSMNYLFKGFKGEELTLENFDTTHVLSMYEMFRECYSLKDLDLGNKFDLSSIADVDNIFKGMNEVNIKLLGNKFDKHNLECLRNVDIEESNPRMYDLDFGDNFGYDRRDDFIKLIRKLPEESRINLDKVEQAQDFSTYLLYWDDEFVYEFNKGKTSIIFYIDVEGKGEVKIPHDVYSFVGNCFKDAQHLKKVIGTSKLHDSMSCLFKEFRGNELILESFDTEYISEMDNMFKNCPHLKRLELGNDFNTMNVTSMSGMFFGITNLEELDLRDKFNTSKVCKMPRMFYGCVGLKRLNLGKNFITDKVHKMEYLFCECKSLEEINLGNYFNTIEVYYMQGLFEYCFSLRRVRANQNFIFYISQDKEFPPKSYGSLLHIDKLDVTHISAKDKSKYLDYTFRGCNSLEEIQFKQ